MEEDKLYHYGVLGMKWGRRKSKAIPSQKKSNKPTTITGYGRLAAKRVRSGAKFINEHPKETARAVLEIASLAATLAGANYIGMALRLSATNTQYRAYTSSPSGVAEIEEWMK